MWCAVKLNRPLVAVHRKGSIVLGWMYFKTKTHIVLLNNVVGAAELGRFRQQREQHIDSEAEITVIPRTDVVRVDVLKKSE